MGDQGTRTGFAWRGDKTRAQAQLKIQVRMMSGKIYGPYARREILSFIDTKKIKGEELILVEGESEWRPITSDTEFFDALQLQMLGKTRPRDVKAEPTQHSKIAPSEIDEEVIAKTTLAQNPRPNKPVAAPAPPPQKRGAMAREAAGYVRPKIETPIAAEVPASGPSSPPSPSPFDLSGPPGNDAPGNFHSPTAKIGAPRRNWGIIAAVVVIAAAVATQLPGGGPRKANNQVTKFGVFNSTFWYSKPLTVLLEGVDLQSPPLPAKVAPSSNVTLPSGFGAAFWIEDLKQLAAAEPAEKLSQNSWLRRAWDEHWLGATLQAFDKTLGDALVNDASAIVAELDKQKLLPANYRALFNGAELARRGDWTKALEALAPARDIEVGAWLGEELQWQLYWANEGRGVNFTRWRAEYESASLDLSAQIREGLLRKDAAKLNEAIEQSATEDPTSPHLWFASAQYNWRFRSDAVQLANQLFVTGLGTQSLQPAAWQAAYWSQYAAFLQTFGRQSTSQRAVANQRALLAGDVDRQGAASWWDLNQEGLEILNQAEAIRVRAASGDQNARDLASLNVLGMVMPKGARYLNLAAQHWAFERNWRRAMPLFTRATKVEPANLEAQGGLVWGYASQHQFDHAFQAQDKLVTMPGAQPGASLYQAVIQLYGREYANAVTGLSDYLRKAPNDAWGHYFLARAYQLSEKNLDCVKSANLARVHGQGELRFRAELTYYACLVGTRKATKKALAELKQKVDAKPANIPLVMTYINALADAELTDQALAKARDTAALAPRSYDMRIVLGEMFERRRDYDRAVAAYQRAHRDRKDAAEPFVKIGRIYELQKNFDRAAENYFTASGLEPEYPEVWLYAARAYSSAGRIKEAAQMFTREIEARPSVLATFIEASEFLLANNAPQEVPALFQKFTADFQDDPRVLTRLAQAYLATGDLDKAQTAASTALARDGKLPEPNRVMGLIYDRQNYYEEAAKYFRRYLELVPQAGDADEIRQKLENPPYR